MARNIPVFLFFIILSSFVLVYAQDDQMEIENFYNETSQEDEAFYIERSEDSIRFIQRLIWEPAEYALHYEVIIEKMEGDNFAEIERVTVQNPTAEVSLPAGLYRYRIDVYDLLGELSSQSEWLEFEIKRALQPGIASFSPNAFYLDEDDTWVITLRGRNLIPESEIWLVPKSFGIQSNFRITPRSIISEGTSAQIEFAGTSLAPGEYSVYVRNPGGLDDIHPETFTITNRKRFDFNLALGYAPIFPLRGFLFEDSGLEAPFPNVIFPLGAAAKINFIPFKILLGYFGAEASVSYNYLKNEREYYTASGSFLNTHLSFIYQKYFLNRKFAANASVGIGFTSLLGFHYDYSIGPPAENITAHYASVTGSVSLTYFFRKPYYINAGVDYLQMLSAGEDVPLPGFFRPSITAGIRL